MGKNVDSRNREMKQNDSNHVLSDEQFSLFNKRNTEKTHKPRLASWPDMEKVPLQLAVLLRLLVITLRDHIWL